ncbi:DUF2474 domain-containing protein [Brucella tritici]|uniref:DUF2474 domain-containing protein n=1 Tax=Brucella tritici TaxID=94626 RepID=A0A6L3YUK1_9HYPH|nr:DUF2474 domain-containing protein [Brucella tritici]KAB2688438.1 DUF2474 domain-containing protein [Brucella tritici]
MKLDTTEKAPPKLWKRLVWFTAIWLASVSALGLVAFAIRLVLKS